MNKNIKKINRKSVSCDGIASLKKHKLVNARKKDVFNEGFVLAPKNLVENKLKIRYMYKEYPHNMFDSGWRFFSGDETDEFVNNAENIGIYDMETNRHY